jgi:hypothetical protein
MGLFAEECIVKMKEVIATIEMQKTWTLAYLLVKLIKIIPNTIGCKQYSLTMTHLLRLRDVCVYQYWRHPKLLLVHDK